MYKLLFCFLVLIFPLGQAFASVPAPNSQAAELAKKCPVAAAWDHQQAVRHEAKAAIKVFALPDVRKELIAMAKADQADRNAWVASKDKKDKKAAEEKTERDDAVRLRRLKAIVKKYGALTPHLVGYGGVEAAWLLAQHSSDPAFQAHYLALVKKRDTGLSRPNIALMTDRVRESEGKLQLYGTQFKLVPGGIKLKPIKDRAGLAARRAAMGLMPLSAYLCMSKIFYDVGS
ncbi:MAG: DUF6624 domain-containing protein [Gammaproteobacteria bacterium]